MKIHVFNDIDKANAALEEFERSGLWIINVRVTPILSPVTFEIRQCISVITGWKKPERDSFQKAYTRGSNQSQP